MRTTLTTLSLLVLLVSSTALAGSFDDLSSADQKRFDGLLDKAITAYDKERFDDALGFVDQAAAILEHPATIYLRARIADRRAQCEDAVALYDKLLALEPAGPPEARWLQEYGDALRQNREDLGDCSFRMDVSCAKADTDAFVVSADRVLGRCPAVVPVSQGQVELTLVRAGAQPSTLKQEAKAGRPVEVAFKALSTRERPSGNGVLELGCAMFPNGAVLFEGSKLLGTCPDAYALSAGRHRLVAKDDKGAEGVLVVEVDPSAPAQQRELVPVRTLSLACADPETQVELSGELLDAPISGRCAELASGVALPEGHYEVVLSRELYGSRTVSFDFDAARNRLDVPVLERLPVQYRVVCADNAEPPVYVRIGERTGLCPMQGELPEGKYSVEARREGHEAWLGEVELRPGQAEVNVPALETKSFFSAGVITSMAGGAVLISAVVVDALGASDLDQLKTIADDPSYCQADLSREGCTATEFAELKGRVEDKILATRILYGVGAATLATGGALLLWELLASDLGDFAEASENAALPRVSPQLSGVTLVWQF